MRAGQIELREVSVLATRDDRSSRRWDMSGIRLASAVSVFVVVAAVLVQTGAWGATFRVNRDRDEPDAAPGNGVCATLRGKCTLRAALQESNALPGADVIEL